MLRDIHRSINQSKKSIYVQKRKRKDSGLIVR